MVVTAPQVTEPDQILDRALRPQKLKDYVGQTAMKRALGISLAAARQRREPLGHTLFYGPAGLGKTTIANVIAKEMGAPFRGTSGPALEKAGDLAAVLTTLPEGGVLFIDEIHRLNRSIEEILYPAMEDFSLDIIIGKGPAAQTLKLTLPPFTLLAATTKIGGLSSPLRSRFESIFQLGFYSHDELCVILERSAKMLKVKASEAGLRAIADRSRATPRVANRLLKRVRDFARGEADGARSPETVSETMKLSDVDGLGLEKNDRQILRVMIEQFRGGPVGLGTLAAATAEEPDTIEDVYEPFLLQQGLIARTSRGRMATPRTYEHLGLIPPNTLL